MPRLSRRQHHQNYLWLHELLKSRPELFAQISPSDQIVLHTYYCHAEAHTQAEVRQLREHHQSVEPALASRAGVALSDLRTLIRDSNSQNLPERVTVQVALRNDSR